MNQLFRIVMCASIVLLMPFAIAATPQTINYQGYLTTPAGTPVTSTVVMLVNSSDISGVKARSGQATTASNFKFDVNASGAINSSDISAVKARSGLTLSP